MTRKACNKVLFIILLIAAGIPLAAQKPYYVSGGEWIFSGSQVYYNATRLNTNMRFTLFFHIEEELHYDFSRLAGVYTGLAIRNIGLILDDYYEPLADNVKIKHRSYSIGIPGAIKIGPLNKNTFFYGGGEIEYLFHYKQKLFYDQEKWKFTEWNSKRVNRLSPSVFFGFQFKNGVNIKAKWYLEDFLNSTFSGTDFGRPVDYSIYSGSRIFYVSLSMKVGQKEIRKILKDDEKVYNASL